MSNLVARHGFLDLSGLLRLANRPPNEAQSLVHLLRETGKHHPHDKTIQLVMYRAKLIKGRMAASIVDAVSQTLIRNGTIKAPLLLSQHTIEFDSYLPDLGSVLNFRETSGRHPENNPLEQLAIAAGIEEHVLREMSRGMNRLVPQEMAVRVAQAAQVVLRLPKPLAVKRLPAHDITLKPLGAESGTVPHKCADSIELRRAVMHWCRDLASAPIAAQ